MMASWVIVEDVNTKLTGLAESSERRSAMPFRRIMRPIWLNGFWSKNSLINVLAMPSITTNRLGFKSCIAAAWDKSSN